MDYKRVALEISKLVEEKNEAYGDAVKKSAEIMRILFPSGIQPSEYERVFLMLRMLDKLSREAVNEDEENYRDICGYSLRQLAAYDNARHVRGYSFKNMLIDDIPTYFDDSDNTINPTITPKSHKDSCTCYDCMNFWLSIK